MAKEKASEEEQSEFNSAIATLKRIDEIKKGLIIATVNRNFEMQFRYLEAYFKELVSIMNTDDDKAQQNRFKEVRKNYHIYREAIAKGQTTISAKVIDSFDDWEIELKEIEQKYGLNMPKKDDPRWGLMSGVKRR